MGVVCDVRGDDSSGRNPYTSNRICPPSSKPHFVRQVLRLAIYIFNVIRKFANWLVLSAHDGLGVFQVSSKPTSIGVERHSMELSSPFRFVCQLGMDATFLDIHHVYVRWMRHVSEQDVVPRTKVLSSNVLHQVLELAV